MVITMQSPFVELMSVTLDGKSISGVIEGDDEQGWLKRYKDGQERVPGDFWETEIVCGKVEFQYGAYKDMTVEQIRGAQLAHALGASPPAHRIIHVDKTCQRVRFAHETESYVFVVIENK